VNSDLYIMVLIKQVSWTVFRRHRQKASSAWMPIPPLQIDTRGNKLAKVSHDLQSRMTLLDPALS
jgi:hypothetical protein